MIKLTERQHQEFIFQWAKHKQKQYPMLKYLHASMTGMKTDAKTAAINKRAGLIKGIPDILLPYPNKTYAGLFIELKTESGRPTKEQKEFIEYLNSVGYKAVVCHGHLEAIKVIEGYLAC